MPDLPLGPYLLHEPIGRGGTGLVWRATHASQGVPVAVKLLDAEPDRNNVLDDAMRVEIETVAALSHPGIVLLYDHGEVGPYAARDSQGELREEQAWLAMELASGGSLADRDPPTTWHELSGIVLALLDALAHAHARGVIHRDLKPSNVLFAGPGDLRPGLKLSDFGIAWSLHGPGEHLSVTGTPRYMAPEQFRGEHRDLGPWTDLYALGGLIWELCTADAPFGQADPAELARRHATEPPPAFHPRLDVPDALEAWLRRALAKRPEQRFRRAADAAWAFHALGTPIRSIGIARMSTAGPSPAVETLDALLATGVLDLTHPTLPDLDELATRADPDAPPSLPADPAPFTPSWRRVSDDHALPHLVGSGLGLYELRVPPLVGREDIQDRLWEALRSAHAGEGVRVVALAGPSGVGKSALARWLTERSHELGAATPLVVQHEASVGGRAGLLGAVARALGVQGLPADKAASRLARRVPDADQVTLDELHSLAGLLSGESSGGRPLDAKGRRALLGRVLVREARRRPVVVWMDDAQWGVESLELVEHVLREAPDARALFVLTLAEEALAEARESRDLLARLRAMDAVQHLDVQPLSLVQTEALIERLLPLEPSLRSRLAARVGGFPLFAVQVLGDWVHRDLLVPEAGRYVLRQGVSPSLPDDLHTVWSERLDRLLARAPIDARRALEVAAALGTWVDDVEWRGAAEVLGIEVPRRLVARLVRARLAVPQQSAWRFAHGMLRESIARSAREAGRWAAVHRAAAEMLAQRDGAGILTRRGRHLLEAGEPDTAVHILLEAGRRYLDRDDARLAGAALEAAARGIREADLADHDPRRGVWDLLTSQVLTTRQDLAQAHRHAADAAARAEAHGWRRLLADAASQLAEIAHTRGDLLASAAGLHDAMTRYEDLGHTAGVARVLRHLAAVCLHLGATDEADGHLQAARAAYVKVGDATGIGLCEVSLGDVARARGDWAQARLAYEAALRTLEDLEDRAGMADALHGLAEVHRLTDDVETAEVWYARVIELDALLGRDSSLSRMNLALCHISRQRYAQALDSLLDLERTWSERARPGWVGVVHVAALPCRAALGQWTAWHRHLTEAEHLLETSAFVDRDVAMLAESAAHLAMQADRAAEARRALELARTQWRALDATDDVERVEQALVTVANATRSP